jgi:PPM family protein phosphatase
VPTGFQPCLLLTSSPPCDLALMPRDRGSAETVFTLSFAASVVDRLTACRRPCDDRATVGGPLRIEVAGETNVGMKRTHNEDNFSIIEESGLYIVADGMGGHASGEIASKMAVDALREFFAATASDPERTWPYKMDRSKGYEENRLITGIKLANLRIFESAQRDSRQRGMGTTIVSLFAVEDGVYLAHVGDSRVYRRRDGKLEQLTEDHSLLNDYIKMKRLTAEEIANFPHKNVIVRALGMKDTVKVDTRLEQPRAGDVYLLCSDGLSGPVSDPDMLDILDDTRDLKSAASALIARANENGGPDNITVVLARWV